MYQPDPGTHKRGLACIVVDGIRIARSRLSHPLHGNTGFCIFILHLLLDLDVAFNCLVLK
jgi:hypothetical protein